MSPLVIIAGFVSGLLIGLTGMGGGALTTPFLILIMRMSPIVAIGTDLAFAALTKSIGGIQHVREANVVPSNVAWMCLGSLPATILSAQLSLRFEDAQFAQALLPRILGVVLLLVAVIFFARTLGFFKSERSTEVRLPSPGALVAVGATGGFFVGLTSIGGGTVIMAMLLIFFVMPIAQMVGLDVVHGAVLTTVAATSYVLTGNTDWSIVAQLLIGSLPGVWLGARMVNRINPRLVAGLIGFLMLVAGLLLLFNPIE